LDGRDKETVLIACWSIESKQDVVLGDEVGISGEMMDEEGTAGLGCYWQSVKRRAGRIGVLRNYGCRASYRVKAQSRRMEQWRKLDKARLRKRLGQAI